MRLVLYYVVPWVGDSAHRTTEHSYEEVSTDIYCHYFSILTTAHIKSVEFIDVSLCLLEVARTNPGNWFNMNPIHCLRSRSVM